MAKKRNDPKIRSAAVCLLVAGAVMTSLAIGCNSRQSPPTSTVNGSVTLKGKPIPEDAEAYIRFTSNDYPDAAAASAPIIDGHYEATNVPQGDVTVSFNIIRQGPEKTSERTGETYRETVNLVPPEAAAGYQVTVTSEIMEKDFSH